MTRARRRPPKVSTELEGAIEAMTDGQLQCRDFGHSWRGYTARWLADLNVYESTLRCTRCRTVRRRHLGPTGHLEDSSYQYSAGYLVTGIGRLTGVDRDRLRLASITRVLTRDQDKG